MKAIPWSRSPPAMKGDEERIREAAARPICRSRSRGKVHRTIRHFLAQPEGTAMSARV